MHYIGIDNGVSGSIGVLSTDLPPEFILPPVKSEQNYTKTKKNITRIDYPKLAEYFARFADHPENVHVMLERPMVNPGRFMATTSALRALEATLIILEQFKFPFEYIDSKEWQKVLLPHGLKGPDELKKASHDIGCRLFPQFTELFDKHKDADGMLIAEYCQRVRR
jgi:hypothetical protein